jgi:Flp pilus assembly protein TadG
MTTQRISIRSERGVALVYVTVAISVLLLCAGLAVDGGTSYLVNAQLSKAVDGAALAAARHLNSGDAEGEARRVFNANFPPGHMGTLGTPNMTFDVQTDAQRGENIVTVTGRAIVPTTFMRLGNHETVAVDAIGEARRRMVDISLVLDVSSSIGSRWAAVRDASRAFVQSFDGGSDRFALTTYGSGARVLVQMQASRGFDKGATTAAIPQNLPGGSTAMVEGLYRGWDELRTVANGQQSGLRVIVLFTDGASNSVPAFYDVQPNVARGLRTADFPDNPPDPDGQTHNNPAIAGLYDTETGAVSNPAYNLTPPYWDSPNTIGAIPWLPLVTAHTHKRSAGIPTSFALQSATLKVRGQPQSAIRGLRQQNAATGRYPAQVFNINNAARNVLEIIADRVRSDADGAYPIRIYTIGMGELVRYDLGTIPEKPEEILMRIANDKNSQDFNAQQLDGKYFYAQTADDVDDAFLALQNEIIRLSK